MSTSYKKPEIQTNHSNLPTYLYIVVAGILYLYGVIATVLFFIDPENEPVINALLLGLGLSASLAPFLLVIFLIFILIMIVLGYVLLKLISWLAEEITILVTILFPFIFIGMGVLFLTLSFETAPIALLCILIGVVGLVIVFWKFQSLRRAGKFVEFSAKLVLDEKAVLWSPIILGLFTIFSMLFMLFGSIQIYDYFGNENGELSLPGTILSLLYSYFYLIVYFGLYYVLNAGVVSYALDWYRGLDPDRKSAAKDIRQTLPIILTFGFATATIRMIMSIVAQAGRNTRSNRSNSKNVGADVIVFMFLAMFYSIFIAIFGAIWQFLNYYTLVSIVENKKGLRESIKDSAKTRWNAFLDTLVGDVGFSLAMGIFFIINVFIWFFAGMGLTYVMFPNGVLGGSWLGLGVIIGIIFAILGFFPYNLVTSPMRIAFTSFLYAYAKDSIEGFKKPSRLPVEFTNEFKELQKRARESGKRKMRDPTQYF